MSSTSCNIGTNPPPGMLSIPDSIGSEVVLMPFSAALWGATCVQTFYYFVHHSLKDSWLFTSLVLWLWLMNTGHMISCLLGVYQLTVPHWGDWAYINTISQEYLWSLFFDTMVSCPVQLFFAYRIWILSNKHFIVPVVFVPLALAQPALTTALIALCYQDTSSNARLFAIDGLMIATWALSVACDVLIAVSLLFFIRAYKKKTQIINGFQSTDRILDRLSVLTVNTGVWTALVSMFTIIALTVWHGNPAFTAVSFLICPLYCNTLLANLNSRAYLRGPSFYSHATEDMTSFAFGASEARTTTRRTDADGVDVEFQPGRTQQSANGDTDSYEKHESEKKVQPEIFAGGLPV